VLSALTITRIIVTYNKMQNIKVYVIVLGDVIKAAVYLNRRYNEGLLYVIRSNYQFLILIPFTVYSEPVNLFFTVSLDDDQPGRNLL
jgi:hypothetical protein